MLEGNADPLSTFEIEKYETKSREKPLNHLLIIQSFVAKVPRETNRELKFMCKF